MDNVQAAPVIPSGTEPTVFGTTTFQNNGQANSTPDSGKSVDVPQQPVPQAPTEKFAGETFEKVAAEHGWKSPDDLARAYKELQSQSTRVEMSFAELAKARESEQTAVPAVEPTTPEEAVKIVQNLIRQELRPLREKQDLQDLLLSRPDTKQYASDMAKVVKENPGISWENAYWVSKARSGALEQKAREEGKQEAYQLTQQKQAANVVKAPRSVSEDTRSLIEIVNDRSIPFSEVQKIIRERTLVS